MFKMQNKNDQLIKSAVCWKIDLKFKNSKFNIFLQNWNYPLWNYTLFSGPYFPLFSQDTGKYRLEKFLIFQCFLRSDSIIFFDAKCEPFRNTRSVRPLWNTKRFLNKIIRFNFLKKLKLYTILFLERYSDAKKSEVSQKRG